MPPSLAGSDVELPGDIDVGSDEVSLPPSLAGSDMELPGDIDGDSNLSAPELPPAVSSPGFDGQSEASSSNIDLPMDIEFSDVEDGRLESVPAGRVSSPSEAKHLTGSHLLAEFYSVPRVSRALDLACLLAFDIHTGWDFAQESMRQLSIWLLHTLSCHAVASMHGVLTITDHVELPTHGYCACKSDLGSRHGVARAQHALCMCSGISWQSLVL